MNILMAEHTHFRSTYQLSCQHLAKELSKLNHKITYISTCISPFHIVQLMKKKRIEIRRKLINYLNGGQVENQNIFSYVPLTLFPLKKGLIFDNKCVKRYHLSCTFPSLERFVGKRKPFDAFLIANPRFIPLIPLVNSKLNILRLPDYLFGFDNITKSERYLFLEGIRKFNKVIVTSIPLKNWLFKNFEINAYYVPNGVDLKHHTSQHNSFKLPCDLKNIPRPIIIYVGAIEHWLDINLLYHVARCLPNISFVVIGLANIQINILKKLPNIFLLGPKSYADIPNYLSHSDIGIIPFNKNVLSHYACPIKLYEYMAHGLSVVATNLEQIREMRSPALLANDEQEFVDAILQASKSPVDPKKCIQFAIDNSWQDRAKDIQRILQS